MIPSTLEKVVDERAKRLEQGLKLAFRSGEMIPLKGIWFRVAEVAPDVLTLRPQSMTKRRGKEVHGG